ncbi:MAG: Serine/threonine-protein kinase pkn1 [Verrucomicrobiota bacterium]
MKHSTPFLIALLSLVHALLHAAEPVPMDLAKRTWQGIPGLERSAKGRVFVSWFTGGTKEPEPLNTVVLAHSDDDGKTFTAPKAMALPLTDGTRCYDPCLWTDPKGRLWYLFNRSIKDSTHHGVYARICDFPDATQPVWGEEFRIGFESPFSFRMNKPVVLSTGEWILPVVHALEPLTGWAGFDPKQVFGAALSTDEGKTWKLQGAVKTEKAGLENMIVERKDGRLWMLIRTEKVLWESLSSDKGRTWSEGRPTTIATPHSRFFIRRLASGHLLLVNHHHFTGRSHLTAQLSTDDGETWNEGLLLDERKGVSYPDGVQEKNGLIWITYDRDRGGQGEILLANFREEDVAAGKNVSGAMRLKQVVNKLDKPSTPPTPKVTQGLLNSIHVTPKLIFNPFPTYAQKYLPFAMAASIESTSKGRLWTCWAGGQDGPNAYLLASYSDNQGKSWRDPVFVIDPQAHGLKMGTRLGSFWCDPKGRLWLFFHQSVGMFDGSCSNWFVRCDNPDAENPVWTQPVYIGFGASLNKPIVRKNGEWILPVSLWERWHIDKPFADCYRELDPVRGANVFVSDDEGGHWRYRGGIIYEDSCFNEHTVAEKQDGTLWMLSRGMKATFQSFSDDGGKTWKPQSSLFPHVNSKAVIRRLHSGNMLVIRHGQDITQATPARQELTAFLTTDEGKTWSGGLLLDERPGVSYPDIAQTPTGDLYVHYDRNRDRDAEILFARFREEDVLAGKLISKDAALKNLVKSRAQGMNRSRPENASPQK